MPQKSHFGFMVFSASILIVIIVAVRQNLFQDVNDMSKAAAISSHNIEYQLAPDRRRPVMRTDKEMGLVELVPDFFGRFTQDDWNEFWDIIYGIHPLMRFKNEKLPPANRNLSTGEIQQVLLERYPEPFKRFGSEQWKVFWAEIFSVIDYKLQISGGDEWSQKQRARAEQKLDRRMQADTQKIANTIENVKETINESTQ